MIRTLSRLVAAALVGSALAASPGFVTAGTGGPDPGANCNNFACYTVTVTLSGNGSGTWKSTNSSLVPDGRINCQILNGAVTGGSQCAYIYGGIERATPIVVHFLMTAAAGSEACDGGTCDDTYDSLFTVNGNITITGDSFSKLAYPLNVSRTGTGTGTVLSTPEGINCGSTCSASLLYGTSIQLTATPNQGSTFGGWTGACAGQQVDCLIGIVGSTTTAAIFNVPTPSPTAGTHPTATPKATPAATPKATTAATPKASQSKPPTATTLPSTDVPSAAASAPPSSGSEPSVGATASVPPGPTGGTPTGGPIESPDAQPAAGSSDNTIAMAILGAGALMAIAIFVIGLLVLRRKPGAGQ